MERTTGMPSGGRTENRNRRNRALLEDDANSGRGILTEILQPVNEGAENPEKIIWTFAKFCRGRVSSSAIIKWKASTGMVDRIGGGASDQPKDRVMQKLRGRNCKTFGQRGSELRANMVDHLRFRLRSVFTLAMSKGVDRNPAVASSRRGTTREGRSRRVRPGRRSP